MVPPPTPSSAKLGYDVQKRDTIFYEILTSDDVTGVTNCDQLLWPHRVLNAQDI